MSEQKIAAKRVRTITPSLKVKIPRRDNDVHEETEHVPSTTLVTATSTSAQGEIKLMISPGRYVVYSRFSNMDLIHIREYCTRLMSDELEQCEYPTQKGVCFTTQRLKALMNRMGDIDEQLRQTSENRSYKEHLGAGLYVTVGGFNGVDLRRHWVPPGQSSIIPTKRGIYLSAYQWNECKKKINELLSIHPTLGEATECFHQTQLEHLECRECLPFDHMRE